MKDLFAPSVIFGRKLKLMIKVQVNERSYEVTESEGVFHLNGNPFHFDVEQLNTSRFHIIRNGRSFRAQLVKSSDDKKTLTLEINNNRYQISVKTKLDLLLEKLGMENAGNVTENEVKAPMPGLILQVMVEEGQEVKKGDPLLILEAMKMENVLKCPTDGVVSNILAEIGQSVEKGKVLIKL